MHTRFYGQPMFRTAALLFSTVFVGSVAAIAVAESGRLLQGTGNWSIETLLPTLDLWAGLSLPAIGLAVEAVVVGWSRSSLRSLLVVRLPSAMSDLVYVLLFIVGGTQALAAIAAFGLISWLEHRANGTVGLLLLDKLSLWLQVPLMWFYMGFVGYWEHRLRHTRWSMRPPAGTIR